MVEPPTEDKIDNKTSNLAAQAMDPDADLAAAATETEVVVVATTAEAGTKITALPKDLPQAPTVVGTTMVAEIAEVIAEEEEVDTTVVAEEEEEVTVVAAEEAATAEEATEVDPV